MTPFSLYVSVHIILTCAVWSRARPCAIGQTLARGRASEEIALHTRIYDGVGEGCAIHTGNTAMSRCTWVPTLYRCNTGKKREGGEGQRCKIVMDFLFSISVIHNLRVGSPHGCCKMTFEGFKVIKGLWKIYSSCIMWIIIFIYELIVVVLLTRFIFVVSCLCLISTQEEQSEMGK